MRSTSGQSLIQPVVQDTGEKNFHGPENDLPLWPHQ